jgi:hypothetical protein
MPPKTGFQIVAHRKWRERGDFKLFGWFHRRETGYGISVKLLYFENSFEECSHKVKTIKKRLEISPKSFSCIW